MHANIEESGISEFGLEICLRASYLELRIAPFWKEISIAFILDYYVRTEKLTIHSDRALLNFEDQGVQRERLRKAVHLYLLFCLYTTAKDKPEFLI